MPNYQSKRNSCYFNVFGESYLCKTSPEVIHLYSSSHVTSVDIIFKFLFFFIYKFCDELCLGLTYNLDDLGQQHSVCDVGLQVLDQALVSRLGEVVVGPVCVDLRSDRNTSSGVSVNNKKKAQKQNMKSSSKTGQLSPRQLIHVFPTP